MALSRYENLQAIAEQRKSTRSFSDKEVNDELITKIITTAKTSPFASGRRSWDIVAITDKKVIAEMVEAVDAKAEEIASDVRDDVKDHFLKYAENFTIFKSAPALLVISFRVTPAMRAVTGLEEISGINMDRDAAVKSVSCVAMLAILAAESLGIDTCYMTGPLIAEKELRKIVGVKPGREIGAIIPIGYRN